MNLVHIMAGGFGGGGGTQPIEDYTNVIAINYNNVETYVTINYNNVETLIDY